MSQRKPNHVSTKSARRIANSFVSINETLNPYSDRVFQYSSPKTNVPNYSSLSQKQYIVNQRSDNHEINLIKRKNAQSVPLRKGSVPNSQSMNKTNINPYTHNQYLYEQKKKEHNKRKRQKYQKKQQKINQILKPFSVQKVAIKPKKKRYDIDLKNMVVQIHQIQQIKGPRSMRKDNRPPRLPSTIKRLNLTERWTKNDLGSPGPSPWKIQSSPYI